MISFWSFNFVWDHSLHLVIDNHFSFSQCLDPLFVSWEFSLFFWQLKLLLNYFVGIVYYKSSLHMIAPSWKTLSLSISYKSKDCLFGLLGKTLWVIHFDSSDVRIMSKFIFKSIVVRFDEFITCENEGNWIIWRDYCNRK